MTAWWRRFEDVTALIRVKMVLDFYPVLDKGGHL